MIDTIFGLKRNVRSFDSPSDLLCRLLSSCSVLGVIRLTIRTFTPSKRLRTTVQTLAAMSSTVESPPTTTFDYWWPYPPQGTPANAASFIASSNLVTTSTFVSSSGSISSSPPPSVLSSSKETSSSHFILITASHPAPSANITFPPEVALKSPRISNLVYIVSAIAIAGGILGAIISSCILKKWTRRTRRRNDTLAQVEEASLRSQRVSVGLSFDHFINQREITADEREPLTNSRLAAFDRRDESRNLTEALPSFGPYVHEPAVRSASWLHAIVSKAPTSLDQPTSIAPHNMTRYRLTETYEREEDMQRTPTSLKPSMNRQTLLSPYSARSNYSDVVYDTTPAHVVRHKSIRRGLIEKIQNSNGAFVRSGWNSGALNGSELGTGGSSEGPATVAADISVMLNSGNDIRARLKIGHTRSDSDLSIKTELASPQHSWDSGRKGKSPNHAKPLPNRIGLSGLGSKFAVPDTLGLENRIQQSPSIDIPKSPPTVWSPSLESELIFSPASPLSNRDKQLPGLPPRRTIPPSQSIIGEVNNPKSPLKSDIELPVTRKRTLHGPRTLAPLDIVSSGTSGERNSTVVPKLAGGPRRSVKKIPVSPESLAQRYNARKNVHKAVEDILSKRYAAQ